jgi:Ca-activated chloride channel family protein
MAANIRVNVNMTLVPVTLLERMGRNVTGLTRENFRVFDGCEPRRIVAFGQQDQPVSVGLIFDCSRSMADKFEKTRHATAELFRQLNDTDESFLITVSDRAQLRQPLTSDFEDVQNALVFTRPDGNTPLLDGVYLGLAQLKKVTIHARRRSSSPTAATITAATRCVNSRRWRRSPTQIFTIGLHDNPKAQEEIDGPRLLERITSATGGIDFPVTDPKQLQNAMAQIGVTLHRQYLLGYYAPESAQTGKYRKTKVGLLVPPNTPRLQVFARAAYYVP